MSCYGNTGVVSPGADFYFVCRCFFVVVLNLSDVRIYFVLCFVCNVGENCYFAYLPGLLIG